MYKPGQLITINNEVYRITEGYFCCYYCHHLNDTKCPSNMLGKCPDICKKQIPSHMFPLHISMYVGKDNKVYSKSTLKTGC